MVSTKSLFFKSTTALLLSSTLSCLAMSPKDTFFQKQADSLQFNNKYTATKDVISITSQFVAPAVAQALIPTITGIRQRIFGRVEADERADLLEAATLNKVQSEEVVNLAAAINHQCVQGAQWPTEECKNLRLHMARVTQDSLNSLDERRKLSDNFLQKKKIIEENLSK